MGTVIAVLYLLCFLAGGICLALRLPGKGSAAVRLWLGLVAGLVLLMWLPTLFSLMLGFTKLSHALALGLLAGLVFCGFFFTRRNAPALRGPFFTREVRAMCLCVLPMLLFYTLTLCNHTITPDTNGNLLTGQCTYGDMNLHLSFITTPVAQGSVPFCYNILPGAMVSYPFLSDTVSSSLYLWGCPLRLAYLLPMLAGALCVFSGAFLFFVQWLKSARRAVLAWVLFFFNGGFGIFYFLDGLRADPSNFTRIFSAYYETPTNLAGSTVRWVNTVVDMMIPQRATLFGWMMLFACLYLLYRAVFEKEKPCWLYAAVLAGLTPMINTHVFLSLGIICAFWLLSRLGRTLPVRIARACAWGAFALAVLAFLVRCAATFGGTLSSADLDSAGLYAFAAGLACCAVAFVLLLVRALRAGEGKALLSTWGLLLGIVLLLALPQLFGFTFRQTGTSSDFLFPHFNWVNGSDLYLWFYLKNMGLPLLLLLPALLSSDKRTKSILSPAAFLLLLADTVSLQPNTYDNNKLLYPAYALLCGVIAIYLARVYGRLRFLRGTRVLAAIVCVLLTCSAVPTMMREYVSGSYVIYDAAQVSAANWIRENTEGDDTVLTDDRINNAVSSLTGRNIVCGSNTLLYFHGHAQEYAERQADVERMYAAPAENAALFEKYGVKLIMISSFERYSYPVDEAALRKLFPVVYETDQVLLLRVR